MCCVCLIGCCSIWMPVWVGANPVCYLPQSQTGHYWRIKHCYLCVGDRDFQRESQEPHTQTGLFYICLNAACLIDWFYFIFLLLNLLLKTKFSFRLVCYTYLFFINEFYLIVMFYALINVYVHVSRLFWATQMQLHVSQRHQLTTSSWVALGTVRASFGTWISCLSLPSWGAIGLPSQRSASTSLLWVNNNVDRITWVTSVVFKLHSIFLLAI